MFLNVFISILLYLSWIFEHTVLYFSTELKLLKLDFDTLQRQAEGTNKEYDRLLGEHAKLQEKGDQLANEGTKKDK